MIRTIACLGLLVSFMSLACRTSTTRTAADAAIAGASGSAYGGAGVAGGGSGMTGAAGADGGVEAGAGGSANGWARVADCGAGTTAAAADATSESEASRGSEAGADGPADVGAGMEDSRVFDALSGRDAKPLTVTEATALYQDSVNNPGTVYSLEELQVPGAWDAMGIQLFSVGFLDDSGYVINVGPYVAFAGKLYPVTKYGGSTEFLSAVVLGDRLYFTMRAGSGISYSELGKIWVSDAGLQVMQSANYVSSSDLYLHESEGQIVVEMGGRGSTFNSWTSPGVFGWLRDDGTRVVAVDAAGAVIPYRFEGAW